MERIYCNPVIVVEVAKELGLTKKQVEEMVSCQSEYTKMVIESGTFDNIRWVYLGVFKSKPKELQILQYLQGMTPEQGAQFKKDIRTGRIRLDAWKDKLKEKQNGNS